MNEDNIPKSDISWREQHFFLHQTKKIKFSSVLVSRGPCPFAFVPYTLKKVLDCRNVTKDVREIRDFATLKYLVSILKEKKLDVLTPQLVNDL